ncbi:molybdate ABC transporter permease subunit [Longimicrobium terrae]|uniref:Molybdenum transport system permease n=1 Tax=Longimicrobium terrae TaxID=1639882 RepID=A0A841H3Q6_9BACT|nr:molybdate ABC transporter permease subunit [Longimicrobium terrae]MBB4638329.1 molybdate transport system permease protein [Longimicrobium terrae]MBB6072603.1 molybdate transport system permease protein [Longimicrobium terrae]NNC28618.1 molybdate ABC transporter permease subunit [Longimicrobium terrae]
MDASPILLSLRVALSALAFVAVAGTLAARWVTRRDFPGRDLVDGLLILPLVLPPVVTGYVLLILLARTGPVGRVLDRAFGIRLVFTLEAAVIAAAVVSFPLMYQSAKAAFAGVDRRLEDAARTLGAGEGRVLLRVTVPLAWPGLVAGMVLAFARALGEFGATAMVAGNIPGVTATVPLAIYALADAGELRQAGMYALVISLFSLSLVVGLNTWTRRRRPGWRPRRRA